MNVAAKLSALGKKLFESVASMHTLKACTTQIHKIAEYDYYSRNGVLRIQIVNGGIHLNVGTWP